MELLDVGADGLGRAELVDLNDVDVVPGSLVDRGHLVVHLVDGTRARGVPELLVQVVDASPRSVTEEDTEVLDPLGAFLVDLERCASAFAVHRHAQFLIQHTTFSETISPFVFLILRSFARKYQNRDLATTSFGAKMRMRYSFGVWLASVGRWRPMTWYS